MNIKHFKIIINSTPPYGSNIVESFETTPSYNIINQPTYDYLKST